MNYLLGSGYYHPKPASDAFIQVWGRTLERYAQPQPTQTVIIGAGASWRALHVDCVPSADVLNFGGNLGHVHDLLEGRKPHAFCGWSMSFLALAMLAYNAELDFIYLEQDCLAIGPWVQRMYADMADGDMVFGGKMKSAPYMPCAQALVLVRHRFIPELVATYLKMGPDGSKTNLPEHKFSALPEAFGSRIRHLSFGCDRERPIPMDDEVFYVQKLSAHEVGELRRRGLIE